MNINALEVIWLCLKGRSWSNHALRVSPAVTRLTVHRRLQVGALAALDAQCKCIKSGMFFKILSIIHAINFVHICFLAQFDHVLSACNGGLLLYAL